MSNSEIVRQHNVGHESVRRWRTRWQGSTAQFEEIESSPAVESEQARMDDLEELICEVLRDEQRSGAPTKFSAEKQVKIIAVACEEPTDSGLKRYAPFIRPPRHCKPRGCTPSVAMK